MDTPETVTQCLFAWFLLVFLFLGEDDIFRKSQMQQCHPEIIARHGQLCAWKGLRWGKLVMFSFVASCAISLWLESSFLFFMDAWHFDTSMLFLHQGPNFPSHGKCQWCIYTMMAMFLQKWFCNEWMMQVNYQWPFMRLSFIWPKEFNKSHGNTVHTGKFQKLFVNIATFPILLNLTSFWICFWMGDQCFGKIPTNITVVICIFIQHITWDNGRFQCHFSLSNCAVTLIFIHTHESAPWDIWNMSLWHHLGIWGWVTCFWWVDVSIVYTSKSSDFIPGVEQMHSSSSAWCWICFWGISQKEA